jgi:hypothetical protein
MMIWTKTKKTQKPGDVRYRWWFAWRPISQVFSNPNSNIVITHYYFWQWVYLKETYKSYNNHDEFGYYWDWEIVKPEVLK